MTIIATLRTDHFDIEVSDSDALRLTLGQLLAPDYTEAVPIDLADDERIQIHLKDVVQNINPAPTPFTQRAKTATDPGDSGPTTQAHRPHGPTVDIEKLSADKMGFMLKQIEEYERTYRLSIILHRDEDMAKMVCRFLERQDILEHSSIYQQLVDQLKAPETKAPETAAASIEALADEIQERDSAEKDSIIRHLRQEQDILRKERDTYLERIDLLQKENFAFKEEVNALRKDREICTQQIVNLQIQAQNLSVSLKTCSTERDGLIKTVNQQGQAIIAANERVKELLQAFENFKL